MLLCVSSVVVFGNALYGFAVFSIVGVLGWTIVIFRILGRKSETRAQPSLSLAYPAKSRIILLFLLGAGFVAWAFMMAVIVVPDDWDAWAIWGSKAKVLALATGALSNVTHFGHADYPLLWPSVWAFSGWLAGGWEEHWSRGWGAVFLLLTAWEIYRIVRNETERSDVAMIGSVMFLSVPAAPLVASWSYAEAPFWLMTTCAVGCLFRWRSTGGWKDLAAGGILAAAAAYTKNEGVLFALLGFAWLLAVHPKGWRNSIVTYAVPFAVLYAPWVLWTRFVLDLGSHATEGVRLDVDSIGRALERLPDAIAMIGSIYMDIKQWNIVLGLIGIGLVYVLWRGDTQKRVDVLLPLSMLLSFLIIILFHHQDLGWQIGTSWNRLTLQVIPLFIVVLLSGASSSLNKPKQPGLIKAPND